MSQFPDFFATAGYVGTATGASKRIGLGFIADWVELESTGALDYYVRFQGTTSQASTDDLRIRACSAENIEDVPISDIVLIATGTSTAGATPYRIVAMRKGRQY